MEFLSNAKSAAMRPYVNSTAVKIAPMNLARVAKIANYKRGVLYAVAKRTNRVTCPNSATATRQNAPPMCLCETERRANLMGDACWARV